jgi:hypothetical protein
MDLLKSIRDGIYGLLSPTTLQKRRPDRQSPETVTRPLTKSKLSQLGYSDETPSRPPRSRVKGGRIEKKRGPRGGKKPTSKGKKGKGKEDDEFIDSADEGLSFVPDGSSDDIRESVEHDETWRTNMGPPGRIKKEWSGARKSLDQSTPETKDMHLARMKREMAEVDREKRWSDAECELYVRLNARGRESMIPASWEKEFRDLPKQLFAAHGEHTNICSLSGSDTKGTMPSLLPFDIC